MAKKKTEESREFGEQVRVNLPTGGTVDTTIKAVTPKTKSVRVDFGKDETTLIYEWQVEGR